MLGCQAVCAGGGDGGLGPQGTACEVGRTLLEKGTISVLVERGEAWRKKMQAAEFLFPSAAALHGIQGRKSAQAARGCPGGIKPWKFIPSALQSSDISGKESLPRDKNCFVYPCYRRCFKNENGSLLSERTYESFFNLVLMGVGVWAGCARKGRDSPCSGEGVVSVAFERMRG